MPPAVRFFIEVCAGLVVTYVIYVFALLAMKADKMNIDELYDQTKQREVEVINGYVSTSDVGTTVTSWNTELPLATNYLPIRPSANMKGGSQFTYTFWLYVGDPVSAKNRTILLKGDKNTYTYRRVEYQTNPERVAMSSNIQSGRVVMCPQISFGEGEMEFDIKFNTIHNMHEIMQIKRTRNENSLFRNNLVSMHNSQWMMLTFVFEDNAPINDFEDGIVISFYIGDVMYQSNKYASAFKLNRGDLFLFPDGVQINDCKVSDVKYYNYALNTKQIYDLALGSPTLTPAATSGSNTFKPIVLSDKNYMDIYNV